MAKGIQKGRGAQISTPNRFHELNPERDAWLEDEQPEPAEDTKYLEVHPRTMLNKVESPDIGMGFSMNPYQGCEHGCVYCYARNTHEYWGYNAGLEFETRILVKRDAAKILDQQLRKPNWEPVPIMLAGNTDCYQPAEQKYQITRQILEVLWKHRHPVGIITKNRLILRDLDLLEKMAANRLVKVAISLTTLDESLRRLLEPRTSSVKGRLDAIKALSERGIPVSVMAAPIIPGLNEHELFAIGEAASKAGASSMGYSMVRLNGQIGTVFADWIERAMPDRAAKVLSKIRSCHSGRLSDSRFGVRMKGEGNISEIIEQQYRLAKKKFFSANPDKVEYNLELFKQVRQPQLSLF